jgi:hypothetical protein
MLIGALLKVTVHRPGQVRSVLNCEGLGIARFLRRQINFNDRSDDSFGETYCSFHQIIEQNDGGVRDDIIKTMHQAMSIAGREPDVSTFAPHGEEPSDPVLG